MPTPNTLHNLKFSILALISLILLSLPPAALPQSTPPQTLQLQAPGPRAVTVAGGAVVGNSGGQTLYYWINVRYAAGVVVMPNPIMIPNTVGAANLSVSNYVNISWAGVVGATGYDVIRSSTALYPGNSCADCAVALNTSALSISDQGAAGSAYPPGGLNQASGAMGTFYIDNTTNSVPYLNFQMLYRATENLIVGLVSGAIANDDCIKYSNGRLVSAGAPCGSGGGGGTAQYLVLAADGTLPNERVYTCGTGMVCTDGGAGNPYTPSVDTAVVATNANVQASGPVLCASTNAAGTTYTCGLTPALSGAYTTNSQVLWTRTNGCTGAPTLNIDTLGAVSVVGADGSTALTTTECAANRRLLLVYDGTNFRAIGGTATGTPTVTYADYPYGAMNTGTSITIGAANRTNFYSWPGPVSRSITTVKLFTYAAGNGAGNSAVAFYDSTCTLIAQSATIPTPANNTTATFTFTPAVTVSPGSYFAWTSDTAANSAYAANASEFNAEMLNTGGSSTTYPVFYGTASTGTTTLTFPATCGTRTNQNKAVPSITAQ